MTSSPRATSASPQSAAPAGARAIAGIIAAVYLALAPLHVPLLSGPAGLVMPPLALASGLLAGACWWHWRSHPFPRWGMELLALVPVCNSLARLGLTGDIEQTPMVMLAIVAVGAGIASRRSAAALVGLTVAGWAVLLLLTGASAAQLAHYGFQIALAVALAYALHELLARREAVLCEARDDLAEQVAAATTARAELESSEARFRSLFTESPVGIGLSDAQGRFVTANEALCRLLGRTESELIGRSSAEFTHPADLPLHARAREIIESAPDHTARIEKRYLRPDGELRWAWLTVSHIEGPDGERWTLAHVQDVTERKAAESALADSEANLAAVAAVVRRRRSGEDVRATIVEATLQIGGASSATLLERDGDDLVVTATENLDILGHRLPLSLSPSAAVHVWHTQSPLFLPGAADSPLVNPELRARAGARSAMFHPIIDQSEVIGVLNANWTEPVASIQERAARAVALLADEAAVALVHGDLLERYTRLATTDSLTGLPNRRAWDERIPQLMATAGRTGRPLVIALADLDRFKAYNDLFGHVQGDVLLRDFAHALTAALRMGDIASRWGGEEFALALPSCTEVEAQLVFDRLRAAVPDNQSVSVGFASWDGHETATAVLERADRALYEAKAAGRNCVVAALPSPRDPRHVPDQRTESPPQHPVAC